MIQMVDRPNTTPIGPIDLQALLYDRDIKDLVLLYKALYG